MTTHKQSIFFKSKLAQRTLLLFILCALVPMVILSLLTTRQIDQLYQEQQHRELRRAAKSVGLLLFERIQFLRRQTLATFSTFISPDEHTLVAAIENLKNTDIEQSIIFDKDSHSRPEWFDQLTQLPANYRQQLDGQGLLITSAVDDLWIVYWLQTSDGEKIVAFKISKRYFWGELDSYDLTKEFEIRNSNEQLLYSSPIQPNNVENTVQYSASWPLHIGLGTIRDEWVIKATAQDANALLKQRQFQRSVQLTTLLAILLASFISLYAIRRNTQPIQALREGIEHINNNRFDQSVTINSGDEFEMLGNTFNNMSKKIGRHITAMQLISTVDQLILNRLKIEDIVDVVMTEGMTLLQAQQIHFLVNDNDTGDFSVFSNDGHISQAISLDEAALQALHKPEHIQPSDELALPAAIVSIITPGTLLYSAVLWQSSNAKAVLLAEFSHYLDDDLLSMANVFVEHMAVALSNADWEARLFQQAHYDLLTGLPNRFLFNEQLSHAISQAQKADQKLGLLFIDIDEFKTANDTLGHSAGDLLLTIMAGRFTDVSANNIISRIGGDEFVMIYGCDSSSRNSVVEETRLMAEKLRSAAMVPVTIDNKELQYSISIGIAIYPDDSDSATHLLQYADTAMYQAKSDGKNRFHYYSDIHNEASNQRELIVSELYRALNDNEFELYYQPKVNLATGIMDGCEALIRWNHPERGFLGPNEFISHAEEFGVIEKIGRWVIREAAMQQKKWLGMSIDLGRIAVNVSVLQMLSKSFSQDVLSILAETGCSGNNLEFEITETAYVEDMEDFTDVLNKLVAAGIIFSVDDYGTGYSSLSLLLRLPIAKVKIDKSFIDNIETDKVSSVIVMSTIALAKEMGISVVAEGVETPGQLSLLIDGRCDSVQGYIFSKPISASKIQALYRESFIRA